MRRLLLLAVGALTFPQPPTPPPSANRLAAEVAERIVSQGAEAPVAIVVRSNSRALSDGFGTVLAAALARAQMGPVVLNALADPIQWARANGVKSLVRLELRVENGQLIAQGDLLGTWVNFWSGKAVTRPPQPAAILRASVDADSEVAAALAPSSDREFRRTEFASLPLRTSALAAGDLDGDGRDEVVALTDEELVIFSADGRVLAKRDHRKQPASPTPCREPVGSVVVVPKTRQVAYFSCRLGKAEVLEFEPSQGSLKLVETADAAPIARSGDSLLWAKALPGQNTFGPEFGAKDQPTVSLGKPFWTLSYLPSSTPPVYLAVFPGGTGTVARGGRSDADHWVLRELGAGSGLVDFEGGGVPALVTSSPRFHSEPEEVRVLQLAKSPTLKWSTVLPIGLILQVTGADLDGTKRQAAVLGVWMPDGSGEIQVVRSSPAQ